MEDQLLGPQGPPGTHRVGGAENDEILAEAFLPFLDGAVSMASHSVKHNDQGKAFYRVRIFRNIEGVRIGFLKEVCGLSQVQAWLAALSPGQVAQVSFDDIGRHVLGLKVVQGLLFNQRILRRQETVNVHPGVVGRC
jgi:hypothetical protein